MNTIDLNCDMGEGIGNDALLMPWISSANIACGYHAGDEKTMWQTVKLALEQGVAIGAHVSFFDRENFGRTKIIMPAEDIYELVTQQLIILKEITDFFDVPIRHVKPHGALYNIAARDPIVAGAIANAVKDFDPSLVLFGLSGSVSIVVAKAIGLKAINEVFADRTYQDDGSLTPRSQSIAMIGKAEQAVSQVLQMLQQGKVRTVTGRDIPIIAQTICIHGDGAHAIEFAEAIQKALKKEQIRISPQ